MTGSVGADVQSETFVTVSVLRSFFLSAMAVVLRVRPSARVAGEQRHLCR